MVWLRPNCSIADVANCSCVLIQSGRPKFLWAEAANTACVIHNFCPHRAIQNRIPKALWAGKEVGPDDYLMLRVFGSQAWMLVEGKD